MNTKPLLHRTTGFLLLLFCLQIVMILTTGQRIKGEESIPKYNVLFVAIDDLNDWVGCLGGNPQVKTPNLDRFAREGGIVFTQAYCPSTVCCPSRSALLTGKHATHTGVYGNGQNLKHASKAKDLETLPEYFGNRGYHTLSAGKIFHKHGDPAGMDEGQWAFHEHVHPGGGNKGFSWEEEPKIDGIKAGGTKFAWGATKAATEETKDFMACKWAADQLDRDFDGKPFFLALGLSKPHLPWYVPQEFFDLYPLDQVVPAPFRRDDLDDIVRDNSRPIFGPGDRFRLADGTKMHAQANRAYLANVSYADHCIGVTLDALDQSDYADNTIVMIWGDHGWHLSEKLQYGKTNLWEESARVPFLVRVPGSVHKDIQCNGVVNLIDIYPTLLELCGLPPNNKNDGRSFAALLADPAKEWTYPTLTTYQYKNHSITDGRYRYTWYGGRAEGAEELYDHTDDPLEYTNLASNPEYENVLVRLRTHLPSHHEPDSPSNPYNELKKSNTKGNSSDL
ncbi:sulfatase [Novipirellula artificiosorum]|uniref:Arylsulfatase n=1 Tax=Novipirellula artificiosorum TaxID=2528016 RepID=A0A5C6DP27_9BACT|nr:sulfatase [Novipirellula artificiosorum]TWU38362.1 Arylsulfatase [Novipirellula artificiosorum]